MVGGFILGVVKIKQFQYIESLSFYTSQASQLTYSWF